MNKETDLYYQMLKRLGNPVSEAECLALAQAFTLLFGEAPLADRVALEETVQEEIDYSSYEELKQESIEVLAQLPKEELKALQEALEKPQGVFFSHATTLSLRFPFVYVRLKHVTYDVIRDAAQSLLMKQGDGNEF